MSPRLISKLLLALTLLLAVAACGGSSTVVGGDAQNDTGNINTNPDVISSKYQIVLTNGSQSVPANTSVELTAQYLEDGKPVDGVTLEWSVDNPANAALNSSEATTNNGGFAKMTVNIGAGGTVVIITVVDKDKKAAPASFVLTVSTKIQAELKVNASYKDGLRTSAEQKSVVTDIAVKLYAKSDAVSCATVATATPKRNEKTGPSAGFNLASLLDPTPYKVFKGFGASDYGEYVAVAEAVNAKGTVFARGCLDTGVTIGAQPTEVTVELKDILPKFVEEYKLELNLDLISVLTSVNDQARLAFSIIDNVLTLFSSPSSAILQIGCTIGQSAGEFYNICKQVFVCTPFDPSDTEGLKGCAVEKGDDGKPKFKGGGLGDIAGGFLIETLDAALNGLIGTNSTLAQIWQSGNAISQMIRSFGLIGTLTFKTAGQPTIEDDNGTKYLKFSTGSIGMSLDALKFKWAYLSDDGKWYVKEGTLSGVSLSGNASKKFVSGAFSGRVDDLTKFTLDEGPLDLNYGVMIDVIVQKVILPLILHGQQAINGTNVDDPTDVNQGYPIPDANYSYAKFFSELIALWTNVSCSTTANCCQKFGEKAGSPWTGTVEGICNALLDNVNKLIEDQLTKLSVSTASDPGDCIKGGFCIGTPLGKPCTLVIDDNNEISKFWDEKDVDEMCPLAGRAFIPGEGDPTIIKWDARYKAVKPGLD